MLTWESTNRDKSVERLSALFAHWRKIFFDMLFPLFCLGCESYGEWLCENCFAKLPLRLDQRCPLCLKQPTPHGERCFACKDVSQLDGLYAASYYQSPLLSYVIHTYKYRFIPQLSEILGAFLVGSLRNTRFPLPDIILPVPLHPRRLRFRGFNQAELISDLVGKNILPDFEIPVKKKILVRQRKTKPQIKTHSRTERLANLTQAFVVSEEGREKVQGKNIWLIDDVSTTGTTLAECAKVLKSAGAKSVFGIVLAR